MKPLKLMRYLAVFGLTVSPVACQSPTSQTTPLPIGKSGEIACVPTTNNPVCEASFAAHPSGSLGGGRVSTGTAIVDGRSVTYTCYPGHAGRQQSRACRW